MAWNSDPKIRDLAAYSEKHSSSIAVVFTVANDGTRFCITTYGKTKQLCKAAGLAGEQLADLVRSGQWPVWPDAEPIITRTEERKQIIEKLVSACKAALSWGLEEKQDPAMAAERKLIVAQINDAIVRGDGAQ